MYGDGGIMYHKYNKIIVGVHENTSLAPSRDKAFIVSYAQFLYQYICIYLYDLEPLIG